MAPDNEPTGTELYVEKALPWTKTMERGALGERARVLKEIDVMIAEGLDDSGRLPVEARYVLRQLRRRVALED